MTHSCNQVYTEMNKIKCFLLLFRFHHGFAFVFRSNMKWNIVPIFFVELESRANARNDWIKWWTGSQSLMLCSFKENSWMHKITFHLYLFVQCAWSCSSDTRAIIFSLKPINFILPWNKIIYLMITFRNGHFLVEKLNQPNAPGN